VGSTFGVEIAEDGASLSGRGFSVGIDVDDVVHVAAEIEDDRPVDALARETGAAATREHRDLLVGAVGHDGGHVVGRHVITRIVVRGGGVGRRAGTGGCHWPWYTLAV